MSLKESVKEYAESDQEISPEKMISELLPRFYPTSDIVLDAARYFATIVKSDEFCVEQDKLNKYGIISIDSSRNTINSSKVKKMMEQYDFIANVDYLQTQESLHTRSGTKYAIQYKLTPEAFFTCLIRSKNSYEYAKYYFRVIRIYRYYEDYFRIRQGDKIDRLFKKLDEEAIRFQELLEKNESKNEDRHIVLQNQITELQSTMNRIVAKLDNYTEYPTNDKLTERFVIMKNNIEDEYYVIRRQQKSLHKTVKDLEQKGFTKLEGIIESETIPNSVCLWNVIRDELKKERKITTKYNTFKLKMNEADLVTIIRTVFDRRKDH